MLHRYKKSVQIIVYGDEMGNNYDKDKTDGQDAEIVTSEQEKDSHATILYKTIKGRPDINKISRRKREEKKKERKSNYLIMGTIILIIVFLILVIMLLVDFFS